MKVYLDNSATTQVYRAAAEEMMEMMTECYGNPSSLHSMGLDAEKKVRAARKSVASVFGGREEEIIFTGSGTESDNMAIYGMAHSRKHQGKELITSAVEHPAVLEVFKRLEGEGFKVHYIGVDRSCMIDMEQLKAAINENTSMISVMTVNNEIGTIMPVKEIAALKGKAVFHTDAVQALGKVDLKGTGADMISVSSHKIHGPKGMGALYVKKGLNLQPLIVGGGQERKMRSGTENTPGIVGFGTAVQICMDNFETRVETMANCRKHLISCLEENLDDIVVNSPEDGCPSVLNISFLGTRGEVLLHTLEQDGIMVSTGSACSSGKKGYSHVLKAMGMTDREIEGAVRFSFSEFNTIEEMEYVADKVTQAVKRFRKLGSFR